MLKLVRTDSNHAGFRELVSLLDQYLAIMDGEEHAFYAQYNKVDTIRHCLVGYWEDQPVACGAIRAFDEQTMEVKRMFVLPDFRGRGFAGQVLAELEQWTQALGLQRCVLETGKRQSEAVALYLKSGYQVIPSYGQYVNMDNSVCMEKYL